MFLFIFETHRDLCATLAELQRIVREFPFLTLSWQRWKRKKRQLERLCKKRAYPVCGMHKRNFWTNTAMQYSRKTTSINPTSPIITDLQAKKSTIIWKNSLELTLVNYLITPTHYYLTKVLTLFSRIRFWKLSLNSDQKGASNANMLMSM